MFQRLTFLFIFASLILTAIKGSCDPIPQISVPPTLNSADVLKAFDKRTTVRAIQNAYDNYNLALITLNTDVALRFQMPEYTEISSDGKTKIETPEQARQRLLALFHDYTRIFAATRVDTVSLDATGGATAQVLDRRTLWGGSASRGTQTDRQCRDYLVQDGGSWHLSRRRVLSEARRSSLLAEEIVPLPTADEKADPVFGPNAPQPVSRYTFFPYFFGSPAVMQFFHNGRSASRSLPVGRPAADYARAFADICTELGVKNKCVKNRVYVTEAGGVALSGNSKVEFQSDTIRP